jgi:hypothetical protein
VTSIWRKAGTTIEFRQHAEALPPRNERETEPAGYVYASTGWFINGEPVTEEVAKALMAHITKAPL